MNSKELPKNSFEKITEKYLVNMIIAENNDTPNNYLVAATDQ